MAPSILVVSSRQETAVRSNVSRMTVAIQLAQRIIFYYVLYRYSRKAIDTLRAQGLISSFKSIYNDFITKIFGLLMKLPSSQRKIKTEMAAARIDMISKLTASESKAGLDRNLALPAEGRDIDWIKNELETLSTLEASDWRKGKVSGAVYHGEGEKVDEAIRTAMLKFLLSNPLHPDVFPGVRKMEAEVVRMVLDMFHAPPDSAGTTTSGGTESILMACKAYKEWAKTTKGITEPEIVLSVSAHAAFEKAANYFGIKLRQIAVDPLSRKVDISGVKRAINRNTVALVGSAPNFPDGIIDDITALGLLASKHKIGLHVDCCLGSFLVPFLDEAGYPSEPFDFRIDAVTSISCDPHKYGFAPKGVSTILYRSSHLRRFQYFVSTSWAGGVYASPSIAGSRPGSLIAGAWATMMAQGRNGYVASCREIVGCAKAIEAGLRRDVPEVQILGKPLVSVIAFSSDVVNILEVGDRLNKRGWHLNALQAPAALHICCTRLTVPHVEEFIQDVKGAVKDVLSDPTVGKGTMTSIYGLGNSSAAGPALVKEVASMFIDTLMGLLSVGKALSWDEVKQKADHVRWHGVQQFLSIWQDLKDRKGDPMLWGDEIEYLVVSMDHSNQNARLSLRQSEILIELAEESARAATKATPMGLVLPTFHPEFGRYMLESTPGTPYNSSIKALLGVEGNMKWRRRLIRRKLKAHEIPVTLTSFPRLGTQGVFLDPHCQPNGQASQSLFLPDELINPHIRFPTLAANIRQRRGSKVAINLPIYRDKNTPWPFIDPTIPWDRRLFPGDKEAEGGAAKTNHVYMDAMGFGMGCCCLQITMQASDIDQARRLYDALVPVAPIMLALTAAAPLFRGYITDVDARWNVIAGAVDDRTEQERGLRPWKPGQCCITKSRYDSVDSYLSNDAKNKPEYNDNVLSVNEELKQVMMERGVDQLLANHIAHLFIRDPIVVFSETLDQDDSIQNDHFENIQSTNWQTCRFKPPPIGSDMGWRVEFRSMEIQLTEYENAAFSIFIVLLSRAILTLDLNFYIPISQVDINMQRAQQKDAARVQKFLFRKDTSSSSSAGDDSIEAEYAEMSLQEIICGGGTFPGLLQLVSDYLDRQTLEPNTRQELERYLLLIRQRADGTLVTTATWLRKFVTTHPEYKQDSVVSARINYDLVQTIDAVERGEQQALELLGSGYRSQDGLDLLTIIGSEDTICVADAPGA